MTEHILRLRLCVVVFRGVGKRSLLRMDKVIIGVGKKTHQLINWSFTYTPDVKNFFSLSGTGCLCLQD